MSGSWGSVGTYGETNVNELQQSIGIPQFSGAAGTDWYLIFNGLLIQGGTISVVAGVNVQPFVTAFPQQVLGVFLQPTAQLSPAVSAISLADFTTDHIGATHDCYWWAIGV